MTETKKNALRYSISALALYLTLGSCSIRSYQSKEDTLYTGIKSIKVEDLKKGDHFAEEALIAAEEQLNYSPNNAVFGSSSLRWPLPLVRPYLRLKYAHSKSLIGKWLYRLGSKPIWIDDVNPKLRAEISKRILGEFGYLGAEVTSQVIPQDEENYRAKVLYTIKLGEPYLIDSVSYLPGFTLSDSTELRHEEVSRLQRGKIFSINNLSEDRNQISQTLRNTGYYYFNPSYITYEADSLQKPQKVQLRSILQKGIPERALRQWSLGKINVRFFNQDMEDLVSIQGNTTTIAPNIKAHHQGKIPIRPKVLNALLRLRPDSLYNSFNEQATLKALSNIGAFTDTELNYSPRNADSISTGNSGKPMIMDMNIIMRRDKIWDVSLGGQFMHKTTGFVGPGATFSLGRKNIFGGGETFSLNASGSYEWQTGHSPFSSNLLSLNSFQIGLDASLTFPTLLLPGKQDEFYHTKSSTTFRLSWQSLNRAKYYGLQTFGLNATYDYQVNEVSTHSITPLSIDYTQLSHTTETFDQILQANPSLMLSLRNQFIPAIGYTYTFQKTLDDRGDTKLWWRSSFKEAGNLVKTATLLGGKRFVDTNNIMGVPYAQFVRMTSELRLSRQMDRKQGFATRASIGAIYSYGNSTVSPYTEQFYVGGANSIRAFTVRSIGPGRFRDDGVASSYSFMDHVGEFKLEFNAEYRYKLTESLELATFLDAGNIWLLRKDKERPGGSLSEVGSMRKFLDQVAVGTGVGIRYDLTYLVLRLDAGIGLHLPYSTSRKGWYNIPKFSDAFGLHLAIGYPF